MKYYDYHIHSHISFDGTAHMTEMCREALQRNISGLMFTEHWELGFEDFGIYLSLADYQKAIAEARKAVPQLDIGMGMELGLQLYLKEEAKKAAEAAPWDFIIGSAHNIGDLSVHGGEFAQGKTQKQCYSLYLLHLQQLAEQLPYFDVLGHLDLVRRQNLFANQDLFYEDYREELDLLLQTLIDKGLGIEVNTAGGRYGLDSAQPHISVIKRYRQLGGEIITCGTDCHTMQSIAYQIPETYQIIKEAGFKYITLFKNRKPQFLALD